MKKILITGANGYIGSHLVKALCDQSEEFYVIAVDIKNEYIDKRAHFIRCNFLDQCEDENLYANLEKPEICIHLAWRDGFVHNSLSHLDDFPRHFHFLKNLLDHGLKHLVVAGSFREYGKINGKADASQYVVPENYYCLSKIMLKRALDIYLDESSAVCFQWIRPFTVYGDDERNQSILTKIIQWEKEGKRTFPFTMGNEYYDYININDLVQQIIAVVSQTEIQGIIDCCSGKPTRLGDKIEEFLKENHFKIRPEYGAYPDRSYDSPVIYGDDSKINAIMNMYKNKNR